MNPIWDARVCNHWRKGNSVFGDACKFQHGYPPAPSAAEPAPSAAAPAPSAAAPTSSESSSCAAGASSAQAEGKGCGKVHHPRQEARSWAHIQLRKGHEEFDLIPRTIGLGGQNMRGIWLATGSKLRIRGRGSGYLEVLNAAGVKVREAPVPLMIAVTAERSNVNKFRKSVEMCVDVLNCVTAEWRIFCDDHHLSDDEKCKPLFFFMEVSRGAEPLLRDLLRRFPHPDGPRTNNKGKVKMCTPGGIVPGAPDREGQDGQAEQEGQEGQEGQDGRATTIVNTTCTAAGTHQQSQLTPESAVYECYDGQWYMWYDSMWWPMRTWTQWPSESWTDVNLHDQNAGTWGYDAEAWQDLESESVDIAHVNEQDMDAADSGYAVDIRSAVSRFMSLEFLDDDVM